MIAVACNFSGVPHNDYRMGLPRGGRWKEILNTDDLAFGGSGVGNFGDLNAERIPWNGRPYSLNLQLPPFGVIFLEPAGQRVGKHLAEDEVPEQEEAPGDPLAE